MSTTTPTTMPALRRKIARLEAQLASLQNFMQQDRESEYETIRRNADMAVRMAQAVDILQGKDE